MTSALTAPVSIGTVSAGSGTIAAVIPVTVAVAPGDAIAVFIGNSSITATISSVVDSRGNTYTESGNSPSRGSAASGWIYVCLATGANGLLVNDTITVTFSTSTGARALRAVSLHGLKSTSPADTAVAGVAATSTAPATTLSGTLAQADEMELGLIVNALGVAADTFTIGGSFTTAGAVFNTTGTNLAIQPAYRIVTANTSNAYSATITSRAWVAMLATYKAGTFPDTEQVSSVLPEIDVIGQRRAVSVVLPETDVIGAQRAVSAVLPEADVIGAQRAVSSVLVEVDQVASTHHAGSYVIFFG